MENLVLMISEHLIPKDKDLDDSLRIMKTRQQVHAVLEPLPYRELDTSFHPYLEVKNLYNSPEGLKAPARNVPHVRTWTSELRNLVFFFHNSFDR